MMRSIHRFRAKPDPPPQLQICRLPHPSPPAPPDAVLTPFIPFLSLYTFEVLLLHSRLPSRSHTSAAAAATVRSSEGCGACGRGRRQLPGGAAELCRQFDRCAEACGVLEEIQVKCGT